MSISPVSVIDSTGIAGRVLVAGVLVPLATDEPTMKVERVAKAFGISRASAYEGIRKGDIASVRIGQRFVVPTAWVRRVLQLDVPGTNGLEVVAPEGRAS